MKTRCKFYVTTSVTNAHEHNNTQTTRVTLNACFSKDPETENFKFWNASPNGKMEITLDPDDPAAEDMTPGSYWYIDVERANEPIEGEKLYKLVSLSKDVSGQTLSVRIVDGYRAYLEVSISNKAVWPVYTALDDLYRLTFTKTEKTKS